MGGVKGEPIFGYAPRNFGCDYTPRQQAILEGNVSLSDIRINEISTLIKKAAIKEDDFNLEIVLDLLEAKRTPTDYFPKMTVEEALEILQRLTPWDLDYFPKEANENSS